MQVVLDDLLTGYEYFFRVYAQNDIGTGVSSTPVSCIPAGKPMPPSSLKIRPHSGTSLLFTYTQDAYDNGNAISSYSLTLTSGKSTLENIVPVTHQVQKVVTSAHTLPYTSNSKFKLSMGDFFGEYVIYVGQNESELNFVDIGDQWTLAVASEPTEGISHNSLINDLTPGEFIKIFGQEFRVCMNEDRSFEKEYGNLTTRSIPLCSIEDPFSYKEFDAGFDKHIIRQIPVYKLDTTLGGARQPTLGSQSIMVNRFDTSVNPLVAELVEGDWISVGHPYEGEVFRVFYSAENYTDGVIYLADKVDAKEPASLSFKSLQHSTYEVQTITFSDGGNTNGDFLASSFRLRFRNVTTFVTEVGGDYGCLTVDSSAAKCEMS